MEFETLKKSHLKRNIIMGVVAVAIISAVILNFTRAKYRVTQSIPLVNGTINYSASDLNTVAVYINTDGGYTKTDTIPESGYALNEKESYCTIDGERDDNINITYDLESKTLSVAPMTTKGTKCYLYFDEYTPPRTMSEIIAGYNVGNRGSFSSAYTTSTTKTVFQTTDWEGTSYYFAGAPTDNWVQFGGFYWRIVRVNGDGTVRLIYNGTSTATEGEETLADTSEVFNSSRNRSEYVGLKYTTGEQHGQGTDSPILNTLQSWYSSSNLDDYASHIDTNVGFCSDRNMANGYTWSSQPSSNIFYAAYERLVNSRSPSLGCSSNDVIKEPVGLITADEVVFAGVGKGSVSTGYYLYNYQYYWTMSPANWNFGPSMFFVSSKGTLGSSGDLTNTWGVRPVINLTADTTFTGDGTATNPYIVNLTN